MRLLQRTLKSGGALETSKAARALKKARCVACGAQCTLGNNTCYFISESGASEAEAAALEAKLQALKALDLAAVADDVAQNRTGTALPGDLGAARHRLLSHADVAAQVKAVRAFHQGSWAIPFCQQA